MTSSGRRSGFQYNLTLMDLIAGHSHTTWCAVSSSIPHFLQSGSDTFPNVWWCFRRRQCPVIISTIALRVFISLCKNFTENGYIATEIKASTIHWYNHLIFRPIGSQLKKVNTQTGIENWNSAVGRSVIEFLQGENVGNNLGRWIQLELTSYPFIRHVAQYRRYV